MVVTGLGRQQPPLLLSNPVQETARPLIIRYAGRNRIEDGLGISVNFFQLDGLSSEVRLNVDVDVALTVVANGCYRWLGRQRRGFEKTAPKQLFRKVVETSGVVEIKEQEVVVHFDKRSHTPIVREAALDSNPEVVPWLGNKTLVFTFS